MFNSKQTYIGNVGNWQISVSEYNTQDARLAVARKYQAHIKYKHTLATILTQVSVRRKR